MIETLGLLAALLIGGTLGLLGGGGSILATPTFAYMLGVTPKGAIIASLVVVGASSIVGGLINRRRGQVDLKRALLFFIGSIPGAFVGALVGSALDDTVQMLLFAGVMIIAAIAMLRTSKETGGSREPNAEPMAERSAGSPLKMVGGIVIGAVIGMITGIVGAGGGFMIVPALTLFFGIPMRRAIGTSMVVIALNSVAGLAGYIVNDDVLPSLLSSSIGRFSFPLYLLLFTILMIAGVIIASRLQSRFRPDGLRKMFALFLLLVGGVVAGINLS